MKKLTIALLFIVLSAGFATQSSAQEVITIQQAVERTLQNNLQIKQSKLNESLSEENLRQAKYDVLPTLNGNGNYSLNFGRSIDPSTNQFISQRFSGFNGNLSVGMDLFAGFQKMNQIKQNKILLSADQTATEKIKNDLVLQVVTSYMQILFNRDLLAASKQQQNVAKLTLNQQQQLLDAGNKTLADVSEAKSQAATAELNVTNAENALTISVLTLSQLMEMPANTPYDVQAPLVNSFSDSGTDTNIQEVYENALKTFPDIKLASLRSEVSLKAMDIAKGSYFPRLTLGGGVGTNYSSGRQVVISRTPTLNQFGQTASGEAVFVPGSDIVTAKQSFGSQFTDNFNQSVGLRLSIPIFNGFLVRSNVRRAKINYQGNILQEQTAKNNLNKVISQSVADLQAARSRYLSTENAFIAQKDAFFVIEQRYNVGLVNSLDYNTSRTNRNKAETDFIQAKYDLLFRAKVIDYYLGRQITF
ncbi:TolC family protein [Pedobacter sp. JCM 36344]|uniref:TolC family protein n=1 Tax=Pedobacter sp. JCM 36344 TaxID=3374280 RepID=UPI00397D2BF9